MDIREPGNYLHNSDIILSMERLFTKHHGERKIHNTNPNSTPTFLTCNAKKFMEKTEIIPNKILDSIRLQFNTRQRLYRQDWMYRTKKFFINIVGTNENSKIKFYISNSYPLFPRNFTSIGNRCFSGQQQKIYVDHKKTISRTESKLPIRIVLVFFSIM